MLLSRGFIYPFSPLFSRERTLFARGDRFSFLFFLLSLRPDRGQRGLLSFAACLLVSRCVSRGNGESKGKEQRQECNSTSAIYAPCSPLMRQQRPIVGFSQGRCQRDKR